jgi:hypothetical protein
MAELKKPEKLIFIYDASGLPEKRISLFLKRTLNPSAIECPLYRLLHGAFGIKPEVTEILKKIGLPYEMMCRDEFIKKYESFEIFGNFKISEATYPSVYIITGGEREEREICELVASRHFSKCEMVACFGKILERKYIQFKKLGYEEFKKVNSLPPSEEKERDDEEEKKKKIITAHKKIADMENEIKKKQAE